MKDKNVKEYKVKPAVVVITIFLLVGLMILPEIFRRVMPKESVEVFDDVYLSLNCVKTIEGGIYSSINVNTLYYNDEFLTLTIVYNVSSEEGGVETSSTVLPEGEVIPFIYDGVDIVENDILKSYKISNEVIDTLNNQYLSNLAKLPSDQRNTLETDGYICNQIVG